MTRRFLRALAPLWLVFGAIWCLALASMLAGNPTAVNAVVGIPFGAAVVVAMTVAVFRGE